MKLISVKILGDNFRSLAANKLYQFNHSFRNDRLSTKVFAGLNGSGKSNFLELFSEIFYFLEVCHLNTVSASEKSNKGFGFEIEYLLPFTAADIFLLIQDQTKKVYSDYIENNKKLVKISETQFETFYLEELENEVLKIWKNVCDNFLNEGYIYVRIEKQLDYEAVYCIKNYQPEGELRKIEDKTTMLLPKKVIAYTSGQNELLSNPYHKLKYHYFKTFEEKKKSGINEELAENHRLFFLDYNTNFSIFVANILLADQDKANILKDILKIKDLQSFRITINTNELYKKVIPVNERLAINLQKLKLCATTWIEKGIGENKLLIIDYLIGSATREALRFHFTNAFSLFKLFYELEIFNLYLVNKRSRDLMIQVHKSYNFSDEMSRPDPSRLVFRIEKIFIAKNIGETGETKNIYYKALSDGEHQFNEVIGMLLMMEQQGCLFLIDEPDTHFNPKWRSKLIKVLNYMAALSIDKKGNIEKVRQQEVIITTHSPFVISDNFSEDVYCFERNNGIVEYKNPDFKTYGASISIILDEIFDKKESISEMAKRELTQMVSDVKTIEDLRRIVDKLNNEFGESAEKLDLFSELRNIKMLLEEN